MPTFRYEIVFPDPAPPEATHKSISWMVQGQTMMQTSPNVPVNQPIYVEVVMPVQDHTPISVVGRWVKEIPVQDGGIDCHRSEDSDQLVFGAIQVPPRPMMLRLGNVIRVDV